MTIAINLIAEYSVRGAGTFTYIRNLFREMGNYKIEDTKFIIYKQTHIPKEHFGVPSNLDVEWVDVPKVGGGIKRILFEQTLFYLYMKKCDVFYSYCSSMPLFVRAKRIFTLHDLCFLVPEKKNSWIKRTYLRAITGLYIKRSNRIITVSEYSKRDICKCYKVSPDKICVTYNFVSNPPDYEEPVTLYDYQNKLIHVDKPFALYVGSLQPAKNIEGMIEGFEESLQVDSDKYLIIVGKPLYKSGPTMTKIINGANVIYLGYQSDDVVSYLYDKCKFTVLLSFCEGFGFPPLEGFAHGKPALVSNATSLPEVAGKAGISVSPYSIADIARGFRELFQNTAGYESAIAEQLNKFSASAAVETFMHELSVKYMKN